MATSATSTRLDAQRAVRLFHALSDGTRLSILQRLRMGERCVCDLTDALDAAQSRLSFHLKVLKDAGLVGDAPAGTRRIYHVDPDGLRALRGYLDHFWDQALAGFKTAVEQSMKETS
jgi:ArsR family transcriptional regulator, arsenate/arsenite/antimonite-responsive transcriptional repressor